MRRRPLRVARRTLRSACAGSLALATAAASQAQSASGVTLTPTFSVSETLTDNRDLSSTNRQADAITVVTPGLRITARNGQLQGGLTLGVNAIHYARASERNQTSLQTALDSAFHYEALDNRFYVDASAIAQQQAISAFGTQSAGTTLTNDNRSQVTTLTVAPGLRTRIADWAVLNVQATASKTDTGSTSLGDTTGYGAQATLSGNAGLFGWGLNASEQISDYKAGHQTTTDQLGGQLSVAPRYDLRLTVRAGRARSDVLTSNPAWVATSGWSIAWQPTDHTDVELQGDRTYYGHSHILSLRHRTPRTVWSYTDTKGASGDANALISVPVTVYDLYYALCIRQGGNDAACRQAVPLVLAQLGITDPTLRVGGGFLNAGVTLQRYQNLSTAWSMPRMTASLSVFRSNTSALDKNNVQGDLALVDNVRQDGMTLGLSHQLTPTATLALALTWQKTHAAGNQPGNDQRLATLSWVGTLTEHASFTLSLRHIDFASVTVPYQETAAVASVNMSF